MRRAVGYALLAVAALLAVLGAWFVLFPRLRADL
jgi:hypothetical protein